MAIVIRICVLLMLLGIADPKEWRNETSSVNGRNVTVCMDGFQIKGTQGLEINFAGFISKHHVSNVMIYNPLKDQSYQMSVNRNYTGRIEKLTIDKHQVCNEFLANPVKYHSEQMRINKHDTGEINVFKMNISLSFHLRHVTFMDSGTYTVTTMEDSVVKGGTRLFVARHTMFGQDGSSMNITFMCNKRNISSITIEMMLFNIFFPVVIYDVSHANCTKFGEVLKNGIESCLFDGITLSFSIRRVTWLDRGMYVAWDDMKFLMDSIFIEIEDTKTSSLETRKGYVTLPSTVKRPTVSMKFTKGTDTKTSSLENSSPYVTIPSTLNGPNDTPRFEKEINKQTLILVSAIVVVVVAAFLAVIAFWMIRHRKVPTTEIERKSTANSSGNLYRNDNKFIPPETTRLVLEANDNAVNLTDAIKGQANIRRKEENIIHRRFDCADSSTTRTTLNVQIDSCAHLYDYISEKHDYCWPRESNIRVSWLSTESVAEQRVEYDYVVQHSFMTLRPPAPDPLLSRKFKFRSTNDHSISWYKRINLKSGSRLDPSYSLTNIERHMESNCTSSRLEKERCHSIHELAPSRYFEFECIRATGTMNSPSWLRYNVVQNWRNVENSDSTNFLPKPEFVEFRDKSTHGQVAEVLHYDSPQCHVDLASMDRRHRKSQSLDDMMAIQSIRWSRRRSARCCTKLNCYDSL
ncbi:hypothetical protein ACJMK2_024951 [Sinanodonta woodiana]|uniref:Uncharacterized protein n=1 Tax=Sinanodonta woodiana TaxID=1069815 RepID=A0ABD3XGI9_SINWO